MASAQSHADDEAAAEIPLPECLHPHRDMTPVAGVVDRKGASLVVAWCPACKGLVEPALGHVFRVDPADVRMGFEAALSLLKQGCRVARESWRRPTARRAAHQQVMLAQGVVRRERPGVDGPGASEPVTNWPVQDVLATDWELVP